MKNGIFVSAVRSARNFDHSTLVSSIARAYAQRGYAVKSEPTLPGGKRSDLAVEIGENWTYIEVKTRTNVRKSRQLSFRQDLLREILRLRAHSLKQLPKKRSSLVVLATSPSATRRNAVSKIAIARSFRDRLFDHDTERVLGLMIFAPFRNPNHVHTSWRYASALIPNPKWEANEEKIEKLEGVQL